MIYSYGISMQGIYHAKKGMVCQDANRTVKVSDNIAVAAVADGLGSQKYTDVAAAMAVNIAAEHCAKGLAGEDIDGDGILRLIREGFTAAQDAIEAKAAENDHTPDEYDTTLTLAVMFGAEIYYGHSGDSGIIALTENGEYVTVTEQQRDADNNVFPLFFRERWEFGKFGQNAASVLLATDGIFEAFFPVLLQDQPVKIHVSLIRFFADNRYLKIDTKGEDAAKARIEDYISKIPEAQVSDDKTVAVLVNTAVTPALQPEEYYKDPDWNALKQKREDEWKKQAYPHLYENAAEPAEQEQAAARTAEPNEDVTAIAEESIAAQEEIAAAEDIQLASAQTIIEEQPEQAIITASASAAIPQGHQKRKTLFMRLFGKK